jgi:uncharacterized SAM-binding protein YcdF (DUF218 family)/lysophospholipase L1-like esterase
MQFFRSPFFSGVLAGILLVFAATTVVNKTAAADWIISPLLMADSTGPAEAIVVLGAGVIGDCAPNHNALRRVLLAVRLWRENPASVILFTGGSRGTCPVAVAMAQTARELGVPDDRIRVEATSTSTRENAELSAPLLRGWGLGRVLLVSDRLHMRRASGVFANLGFAVQRASVPIYEGHEDNVSMLNAGLREFAALGYYRMRGWIGETPSSVEPAQPVARNTMRGTYSSMTGPIVLLGASYAAGWPLSQVRGIPVVNKGVAGEQSFELLERFDRDVASASPRAVILWGFSNDIHHAQPDSMDQTIARVRDSYAQLIARARQHGVEPILATELTLRPPESFSESVAGWAGALRGKGSYQDQVNRHVLAVNRWLVDTATHEGLLVLDFQPVLSEPGGRRRPAFAQPDGSHITPAGYDALTSFVTPILEEHFLAR